MGKIIFVKNNKGGVGKSTISRNLSVGLARMEYKTALLSFDSQNDSLILLGKEFNRGDKGLKALIVDREEDVKIRVRENLDYYPLETDSVSIHLKEKLTSLVNELKNHYDIVVIDGAPSKDAFLSVAGSELSDEILVPICLDKLSVEGIGRMLETQEESKISYIVPNLYNRRKTENEIYSQLSEFLEDTGIYLSEPIPNSSIEANLASKGKSIFDTAAKTAEGIQERYFSLIEEVVNNVEA